MLTLVGVGVAIVFLPRTYQASASVVLLDSRNGSEATGGNPYLNFNASLTLTADAISRQVMDPQTASSLATHGFLGSYTVEMPTYSTSTTGSVLLITVTSNAGGGVQHTLNGVIAAVRTSLATLQSGVRPADRIQLTVWCLRRAHLSTARTPCARSLSSPDSAWSSPLARPGCLTPR